MEAGVVCRWLLLVHEILLDFHDGRPRPIGDLEVPYGCDDVYLYRAVVTNLV